MSSNRMVIGSRASPLAMVQAHSVRDMLKRSFPALDIVIETIKTKGDKITDVALSKIGDKGLFTKEIEDALLERRIDLAVHSMKDLPTKLPRGLKIAAITAREDPRDVLVSELGFTISALPKGSRVGTSSLRRRAQLLHARKDLDIIDLRGNLDTRIEKLRRRSYDAIILAHAGIKRLGLSINLSAIPIEEMLPQAGQGAIGIEVRGDAGQTVAMVSVLDDADCHCAVDAERTVLDVLEGGCQAPIGVYAGITGGRVTIKAGVFSPDGKIAVKDEISGRRQDAAGLGRKLAERILAKKAARRILDEIKR